LEKLKETKGSRESSAKVQQYLDGLLKIHFGIYKKEPLLSKSEHLLHRPKRKIIQNKWLKENNITYIS
jgi:hypothetical protein